MGAPNLLQNHYSKKELFLFGKEMEAYTGFKGGGEETGLFSLER